MSKRVRGVTAVIGVGLLAIALPLSSARAADGAKLYADNCASCHGDKGQGGGPLNVAASAKTIKGKSDADLAKVIKDGKNTMPPFASLSDDDVKSLVGAIKKMK